MVGIGYLNHLHLLSSYFAFCCLLGLRCVCLLFWKGRSLSFGGLLLVLDPTNHSAIQALNQRCLCNNLSVFTNNTMCQFEVIHFHCGHAGRRLIKHCHFARNEPNHACFGAWAIKREWISANQICQQCGQQAMMRRAQQAQLRL